jgi:hypothetical protein
MIRRSRATAPDSSMPDRPTLRLFLSSSMDVLAERDAAERVVRDLARELADRIDLRLVRWENFEKRADQGSYQDNVERVARVEDCDLLIGILWTRIGLALSPDKAQTLPWPKLESQLGAWDLPVTGTSYEWLAAVAHMPQVDVLLFRKDAKPPPIDEADEHQAELVLEQRRLAKAFWNRLVLNHDGSFRFAYHQVDSTAAFVRALDRALRQWLRTKACLLYTSPSPRDH